MEEPFVLEQVEVPEHAAVRHVVSVQERVGIAEIGSVSRIEEDASRQREIAVDVGVDVGQVVFALHYGEVDVRIVDGDPCADVLVDGEEFVEGRAFFFFFAFRGHGYFGFEFDHIRLHIVGGGIDLFVVPESVDGVGSGNDQENGDNEGNEGVCTPEKEFGKGHLNGRNPVVRGTVCPPEPGLVGLLRFELVQLRLN